LVAVKTAVGVYDDRIVLAASYKVRVPAREVEMRERLEAHGFRLTGVLDEDGIGVIFYTRKGSFLYKISLYIIIYLGCIIVYHVYHHHVSHISCPSSTHDISLVSSSFLRHVISCDLMSRF